MYFHLYKFAEQTSLTSSDTNQINICLGREGRNLLGRHEGTFGVMEMFYILIRMVVTQVHTFVKPYKTVSLKQVSFIGRKSYLC